MDDKVPYLVGFRNGYNMARDLPDAKDTADEILERTYDFLPYQKIVDPDEQHPQIHYLLDTDCISVEDPGNCVVVSRKDFLQMADALRRLPKGDIDEL